jgi:hypothetical protein
MSAARQRDDLGVAPFARFPSRPESASGGLEDHVGRYRQLAEAGARKGDR